MSQDQVDSRRLTGVVGIAATLDCRAAPVSPGPAVSGALTASWSHIWSQPGALLPLPRLLSAIPST